MVKYSGLLFIFLLNVCHADDAWLYRVDTRPPDQVFTEGFHPLGENHSLLEHVRGGSCNHGNQTSAYISVTDNFGYAQNYAMRLSGNLPENREPQNNDVYIYTIRQTNRFFNMERTLGRLRARGANITVRRQANNAMPSARQQGEWFIDETIEPILIREARRVNFRQLSEGEPSQPTVSNPEYQDGTSSVNRGVYNNSNEEENLRSPYFRFAPANLVNVCFSATLWCLGRGGEGSDDSVEKSKRCPIQRVNVFFQLPLSAELNSTIFATSYIHDEL